MTKRSKPAMFDGPTHEDKARWEALLRLIDYKPGWSFNLVDRLSAQHLLTIQVKMLIWDTMAERELSPIVVTTRYEIPMGHYGKDFTYSRGLDFVLDIILLIENHEAREWFRFDGMQCFNPHGPSQMLGRRVEGWEWFSPAALSIAPHLKEKT